MVDLQGSVIAKNGGLRIQESRETKAGYLAVWVVGAGSWVDAWWVLVVDTVEVVAWWSSISGNVAEWVVGAGSWADAGWVSVSLGEADSHGAGHDQKSQEDLRHFD